MLGRMQNVVKFTLAAGLNPEGHHFHRLSALIRIKAGAPALIYMAPQAFKRAEEHVAMGAYRFTMETISASLPGRACQLVNLL